MIIEQITRYRFDGKEFDSLRDVGSYIENEIGKVIDSTPNRIARTDALAVYDVLVKNRTRLIKLLSAEFYTDPDDLQPEKRSIFDL